MDKPADDMRIKTRKKLNSVRRFIGAKMSESLQTMPQASPYFELETDALFALKDELKAKNDKVTVTSMFVRIMATVLREYPLLNSAVIGEELITYESCNVAVGVGLESGIMTAVIREAQDKDIFAVSEELREKTDLVKQGRLPLADMKNSTFTISSIGVQGIRFSTVILNPPECAMLAIGVTEKRLVVLDDDSTAVRRVTGFGLTHNHAVLDGYHIGAAIELMRQRLQNPAAYMGL
ncbi:MAG: 2-oxo acid dehydrogenase subunit E2 [Synergistaceae bacterium]|jgi:pyruvate/2-oxoglutarate dehydrogenase complex dihydrolipoamide acyltransferase (E2) component|nr:2-oxo acid dehydrogenase subunit E2 [Synergistaceae bacterium]